jgi:hypothetical protein
MFGSAVFLVLALLLAIAVMLLKMWLVEEREEGALSFIFVVESLFATYGLAKFLFYAATHL